VRVIGFHEYDKSYSYAVLELDGSVCEVGDLRIARHVDLARDAEQYTDNYVHYIAHAMVAKAAVWEAYIGIEDTSYKKEQPSLSRDQNREIYRRPSGRIIAVTKYKALMAGMLTGITHYKSATNVIYSTHMYSIANKDRYHGTRDEHITSLWASS